MNTNSIPKETINLVNDILRRYGVDICELLSSAEKETKESTSSPKYLTVADAGKIYGVGRWMIWRAAKAKKLHTVKPNGRGSKQGRVLIDRKSLENWIEGKSPEAEVPHEA